VQYGHFSIKKKYYYTRVSSTEIINEYSKNKLKAISFT